MLASLDNTDLQIIHLLRNNSTITLKDMEKKLDKKVSTLHNRIKRLEENGIIEKYSALVNYSKLGYPLVAFIMMSFDKTETNLDQIQVAGKLSEIPRIEEVHLIAGEFDILVKMRAKNIDDLGSFVTKELKEFQGIGGSRTFISLKITKEYKDEPFLTREIVDELEDD